MNEEGADVRFGTFVTHSKQDTRYNASLVFFLSKGARRSGFIYFSVFFIVLLSLLIFILKICIKDTMKTYFCYRHMFL